VFAAKILSVDLRTLISEYLKKAKLMQIATVKNDKPWVASVWYVVDNELNLYFMSKDSRRHSLEIKNNPNVAGAIVIPHKTLGDKTRGLQFEGTCKEVKGTAALKTFTLFIKTYPMITKFVSSTKELLKSPHRFYKVTPNQIVLFDELNFPDNPRQELNLS
jgi:uncharacterized protein YhbP (UPF0306 family)